MTLYLKYRPQTIEDLDLKSVRESLKNTLSKENIPHAFLFAGPKGTGKTSAARIVAKALNCQKPLTISSSQFADRRSMEPCNECSTCISITRGENLDCIEIDAASNRGIDDIRILREVVKLSPVNSQKKIYIIDEAHMLTTEACNALLKVLEEPPNHVVFILATTNPEKLIDTIRSRTTLIQFTKATQEDIIRRLKKVSDGEGIKVEEEILGLIAQSADGAFRDAVKVFEQITNGNIPLTRESVGEFLFGNSSFNPNQFIDLLLKKETKNALNLIEHGIQNGIAAKTMAKGILDILRAKLLGKITNNKLRPVAQSYGGVRQMTKETLDLIELFSKAYSELPHAYLEQLPLEIAVVKWCEGKLIANSESQIEEKIKPPVDHKQSATSNKLPKSESAPEGKANGESQIADSKTTQSEKSVKTISDQRSAMSASVDAVVTDSEIFPDATWVKVLSEIRPKNAATEALLRACKPFGFDGKILSIGVFYKFHKERLEAHPHRDLLEETLELILGSPIRISCTLTEPPTKKIEEEVKRNEVVLIESDSILTETKQSDTILKAAKDIFGG